MSIFKKKKEILDFDSPFAVIESTSSAKNNFVDDKFTKKIFLYSNWGNYVRKRPYKEMDYTEEDIKNIREILELPIISEELETEFEFDQEENFGEVTTRA